jgi:hypothetical protein
MVIGLSGEPLKLQPTPNGYKIFELGGKSVSAHRFIYSYFRGEIPEGLVIDHINGDKSDNRLNNLQAITQYENTVRGKLGKLTIEDVAEIKALLGSTTQRAIAKRFGVSEQLICDIKKGRKHHG